jgi:hypothetical protein
VYPQPVNPMDSSGLKANRASVQILTMQISSPGKEQEFADANQ